MPDFGETLCMIYFLAWFGCLMCSWNDWAYMGWVALTVAPFLIDW
jgi:hypothetical protein